MRRFPKRLGVLALAGACVFVTHGRVCGEEKESTVPPEITAKCTVFLKKVVAARRKGLDKRMADEIAEVVKVTGLDANGVKSLEAAAVTAEDAAQEDLLAKSLELFTKTYAKTGGQGMEGFDRPELVEAMANNESGYDMGVRYTRALDQPSWADALAHTLTPAQAAAWQKARDEKIGAVSKEIEAALDRQADQIRTSLSSPMFTKSTEIIDTLSLPKERADAVTDLAKKAIDASMESWRKEARKQFMSNDATTRQRLARGMQFYAPTKEEDAPDNQPVWTQGIARLLSDDDRAKLAASHGSQRKRRTHALALLMVTILDDKVAFTASQRPKLEPIMERLVPKVEELYPQNDNGDYFSLNPTLFYKAAAGATAEELRPILDEVQWKRWQNLKHEKNPGYNDDEDESAQPTPTPAKKSADAFEEPEDLERFVSDYLQGKAAAQHKELNAAMLLQAEDAARVAALPPVTTARLRTAAYGAAETALSSWSMSLEQTIHAQVQGATRESIQQRLNSTNRYYFGQVSAKEQPVWKQAVKTDLTPEQQAAWQVEKDARAQYGDAAIAQFLLAEFDRNFALTPEQWDKLAPALTGAIRDYRPDILQMFSYNTPQWYLTSYYMFLPMHAIPEADCKALIGKERYDRWAESNGYRYSVQYWSNLKDYHDRRAKEEKK